MQPFEEVPFLTGPMVRLLFCNFADERNGIAAKPTVSALIGTIHAVGEFAKTGRCFAANERTKSGGPSDTEEFGKRLLEGPEYSGVSGVVVFVEHLIIGRDELAAHIHEAPSAVFDIDADSDFAGEGVGNNDIAPGVGDGASHFRIAERIRLVDDQVGSTGGVFANRDVERAADDAIAKKGCLQGDAGGKPFVFAFSV